MSNSIKNTDIGKITISIDIDDTNKQLILFKIEDTGLGISEYD